MGCVCDSTGIYVCGGWSFEKTFSVVFIEL